MTIKSLITIDLIRKEEIIIRSLLTNITQERKTGLTQRDIISIQRNPTDIRKNLSLKMIKNSQDIFHTRNLIKIGERRSQIKIGGRRNQRRESMFHHSKTQNMNLGHLNRHLTGETRKHLSITMMPSQ